MRAVHPIWSSAIFDRRSCNTLPSLSKRWAGVKKLCRRARELGDGERATSARRLGNMTAHVEAPVLATTAADTDALDADEVELREPAMDLGAKVAAPPPPF